MKSKKKILIVGGTGFIGYHLARKALKRDWKVTSISTKLPKKIRKLPKVKYLLCDISQEKNVNKKLKDAYDYVVNLGGYVDHSNTTKVIKSHFQGCKNLTKFFLKKKIKSFVQIGTAGEYGKAKSPQKESMKCNLKKIKSNYAKAKLLSTKHVIDLFKKKKFPSTVVRLYQAYGPKQDFNRFIPIVIKACIKNKKFPCSSGNQFRDFIYIEDVIDAIFKILLCQKAKGQIFNIATGKPKKIKDIIKYINKNLNGGYPLYGKIKLRKDEIIKSYANIVKAKNIIGWKPKFSFKEGLNLTIKYYDSRSI